MREVTDNATTDVAIYLVGNKAEMEEEREVTFERALNFAKTNNIAMVFETSAKTGNNVEDVFTCALKHLYEKRNMGVSYNDQKKFADFKITEETSNVPPKKKKCC